MGSFSKGYRSNGWLQLEIGLTVATVKELGFGFRLQLGFGFGFGFGFGSRLGFEFQLGLGSSKVFGKL